MIPVYSTILVIISVGIFALSAFLCRKNRYISPLLIISFVFVAFTTYSFIYLIYKKVDITYKTMLILSAVDIIFFLSDIGIRKLLKSKKKIASQNDKPIIYSRISINIFVMMALAIVFAAATFWQFKTIYNQILEHGYTNIKTIKAFYYAMRNIYTSNFTGFKFNFILTQLIAIQRCFVYISIFIFVHNVVIYGFKVKDLVFLMPLPSYCVAMFLTSGRTEMLMFVFFVVFIIMFAFSVIEQDTKLIDKTIKILALLTAILTAVSLFYGFYVLTTPNRIVNIFDYFYGYSAGSIYNLDKLLNGGVEYTNISFGSHTLYSIYSTLSKFGFKVPNLPNSYLPATESFGKNTNIYTAVGRWYMDYGYVGILILSAAWSSLYNFFYYKFVEKPKVSLNLFLYTIFLYPLITFLVEDSFFTVFSVSLVYKLIYFAVLYLLFVERYRKKMMIDDKTFIYLDSNKEETDFAVIVYGLPALKENEHFNEILSYQYKLKDVKTYCFVNEFLEKDTELINYVKLGNIQHNIAQIKNIVKKEKKNYILLLSGNVFSKKLRTNADFSDAINISRTSDLTCLKYESCKLGIFMHGISSYRFRKNKKMSINTEKDVCLIKSKLFLKAKCNSRKDMLSEVINKLLDTNKMSFIDSDNSYIFINKNNKRSSLYSLAVANINKRKD